MSMLSHQCDELRILADKLRRVNPADGADYVRSVEMLYQSMVAMHKAADTIESLLDRLQAPEDATQSFKWAELQSRLAEAERRAAMFERVADDQKSRNRDMRNTVNAVTGAGTKSRWYQLFGTPEKAARTFADFCDKCDKGECNDCPMDKLTDFCIGYDDLLEWLKQEVDA